MDHTVYLDEAEGDLEVLRSGRKTMIALGMNERGACGRISEGDGILFAAGPEKGTVRARASAAKVISSPPLSPESCGELLVSHATALALTEKQAKQLVMKRYLTLIEFRDLELVGPSVAEGQQADGPAHVGIS